MRLLLDTHALIWFLEGSTSLSDPARAAIEDSANEIYVSSASAWEMAIKISLEKLDLKLPYKEFFRFAIEENGFVLLDIQLRHFEKILTLPRLHGDPFDRLLIAQSIAEDLTIVSSDRQFPAYGVPVFW